MKTVSRKEAKERGLLRYFTGVPCKRGHICERSFLNGCLECCKQRSTSHEWQKANRKKANITAAKWRNKNKDIANARFREWRKHNRNKAIQACKNWYQLNKDHASSYSKKWRKENAGKVANQISKRRAAVLHRTPSWLTNEDWKIIELFYECCPKTCVVDHIIPLQGENISGLHVPQNLQWLTEQQNAVKSNKYSL